MKNIVKYFSFLLAVTLLIQCKPNEDRADISGVAPSAAKYTVTQTNGYTILSLQNNDAVPYWEISSYPDKQKLFSGNLRQDTIIIPFLGDYWLRYYAYFNSGCAIDSQKIHINDNSTVYFEDPKWNYLTSGAAGKTWVLDPLHPMGFYGTTYPDTTKKTGTDTWSWIPDYIGNEWIWVDPWRDNFGSMTFDLNSAFNFSKTETSKDGVTTDTKGSWTLDLKTNLMNINGSTLLTGGQNIAPGILTSTSQNLKVFKITQDTLIIAVYRIKTAKDGACYLGFMYTPAVAKK